MFVPVSPQAGAHRDLQSSWIAPAASKGRLLYVSDSTTDDVYIFSYPSGTLVGTLTGFDYPAGMCVDRRDHVYVTETNAARILEFARNSTSPIRMLHDRENSAPWGCSVDPTTGDLAVMNSGNLTQTGKGEIAIYRKARGRPTHFRAMVHPYFCAYDSVGNLFVDGFSWKYQRFRFGELPKGGSYERIALHQSILIPGSVAWHEERLEVGDASRGTIYDFNVQGRDATEVGSTPLNGIFQAWTFWIDGSKVISPNFEGGSGSTPAVFVYDYPAGGNPVKMIGEGVVESPFGVVLIGRR